MKEATQIRCLCLARNTYTVVVNMYAMFNVTPLNSLLWYFSTHIPIGLCFASGGQTANW